jgi:hypothetical protein
MAVNPMEMLAELMAAVPQPEEQKPSPVATFGKSLFDNLAMGDRGRIGGESVSAPLRVMDYTPIGQGAKLGAAVVSAASEAMAPEVVQARKPQSRIAPAPAESPVWKSPETQPTTGGRSSEGVTLSGSVAPVEAAQAGYIGDAEQRKAAAMQTSAIDEQSAVEVETATRLAAAQSRKQAYAEEVALAAASREAVLAEERSRAETEYRSAVADLQKIDPKIDPNRYWANKSTEQKIAGGLAAALFGFAGKGMDFLAMVNQEIDRDIDVQKSEFAQRRAIASDKVSGAKGSYEMMMDKVKDDRLAREAIKTARLNALDQEMSTIIAQMKPGQQQAAALIAKAGVQKQLAESKLKIDQVNASTAIANAQLRQQAAIQTATLRYKAMAADATTSGDNKKSLAGEQSAIAKYRDQITEMDEGMKKLEKRGALSKIYEEITPEFAQKYQGKFNGVLDALGLPSFNKFFNELAAHQSYMKNMAFAIHHAAAGVLSKAEAQQALELYNKGGVMSGADLALLRQLKEKAQRKMDEVIRSGNAMGTLQGLNPTSAQMDAAENPAPSANAVPVAAGEEGGVEE